MPLSEQIPALLAELREEGAITAHAAEGARKLAENAEVVGIEQGVGAFGSPTLSRLGGPEAVKACLKPNALVTIKNRLAR
jgi:hypothetical protein